MNHVATNIAVIIITTFIAWGLLTLIRGRPPVEVGPDERLRREVARIERERPHYIVHSTDDYWEKHHDKA